MRWYLAPFLPRRNCFLCLLRGSPRNEDASTPLLRGEGTLVVLAILGGLSSALNAALHAKLLQTRASQSNCDGRPHGGEQSPGSVYGSTFSPWKLYLWHESPPLFKICHCGFHAHHLGPNKSRSFLRKHVSVLKTLSQKAGLHGITKTLSVWCPRPFPSSICPRGEMSCKCPPQTFWLVPGQSGGAQTGRNRFSSWLKGVCPHGPRGHQGGHCVGTGSGAVSPLGAQLNDRHSFLGVMTEH